MDLKPDLQPPTPPQGALVGKPAGVFFGTACQNGGQETTALTTVPFFAHQGMVFVPMG